MRTVSIALCALALGLAACTDPLDGPDLVGVWEVDAHTRDTAGCGAGTATDDPPFIEFTKQSIIGVEYLLYAPCSDASTCEEPNALAGIGYNTEISGGYLAERYDAIDSEGQCSMIVTYSTAILDGSTLTIDTKLSSIIVDSEPGICTSSEVKRRYDAGSIACSSRDVMTTTRN